MKTPLFSFAVMLFILLTTTFTTAQWIRTDTLCSGSVRALTVYNAYLFAGTAKGIFRSSDCGKKWTALDSGLTTTDVLSFGVCGTHLFAGTFTGGVFRSSDNGATWSAANTGLTIQNVNALAECKNNIFAGVYDYINGGGVYRSTDNGNNWSAVNNGLTNNEVRALAVNDSIIIAGTRGGIFLSTNYGSDWTVKNAGLASQYVVTLIVHVSNIFAGTIAGGTFRSTDNCANWTAINAATMDKYINALAVSGDSIVFAGTGWGGVFLSTNNGTHWSAVNTGLTTSQINALACGSDGKGKEYLYAGTNIGVWSRPISEMVTEVLRHQSETIDHFILYQNYPNPFNPSTVISYQLPKNSKVSLKIFDPLGREIATLVNEEQTAGWKEVTWNAVQHASGIYFYKINTQNFYQAKKLLLLK